MIKAIPSAWTLRDDDRILGGVKKTLLGFYGSYLGQELGSFDTLNLAVNAVKEADDYRSQQLEGVISD
jgi:hypothetical protein